MVHASPTLSSLRIAADPARWRDIGLPLDADGVACVGGVAVAVAPPDEPEGEAVLSWAWDGLGPDADLDGIPTDRPAAGSGPRSDAIVAVDHVVVTTGDLERTVGAFDAARLDRRRIRDAGAIRQAFYLAGPALVEVVAPADPTGEPARLWGITFVAADLDIAAERLGPLLGEVRDAVQPGRRIATVRREAGLGLPVALMTPRR